MDFTSSLTSAQITDRINKYKKLLAVFRRDLPNAKLGIYLAMPSRNWLAVCGDPAKRASRYATWHSLNLKLQPLAAAVDIIVPSLYAFYADSASMRAGRPMRRPKSRKPGSTASRSGRSFG